MRPRYTAPLILLGMLAMALPARADQAERIAIANPAKIFMDMQETKDLVDKLKNDQTDLQKLSDEKKAKLQDLDSQRKFYKEDTQQYQDKSREILQASIEYDVWAKMTDADLQRRQKEEIKTLFGKIQDAIATVAKQKGISLVLADQRSEIPDNLDQIELTALRALISQRTVLYFDNNPSVGIDITQDVLTLLDTNYKANK